MNNFIVFDPSDEDSTLPKNTSNNLLSLEVFTVDEIFSECTKLTKDEILFGDQNTCMRLILSLSITIDDVIKKFKSLGEMDKNRFGIHLGYLKSGINSSDFDGNLLSYDMIIDIILNKLYPKLIEGEKESTQMFLSVSKDCFINYIVDDTVYKLEHKPLNTSFSYRFNGDIKEGLEVIKSGNKKEIVKFFERENLDELFESKDLDKQILDGSISDKTQDLIHDEYTFGIDYSAFKNTVGMLENMSKDDILLAFIINYKTITASSNFDAKILLILGKGLYDQYQYYLQHNPDNYLELFFNYINFRITELDYSRKEYENIKNTSYLYTTIGYKSLSNLGSIDFLYESKPREHYLTQQYCNSNYDIDFYTYISTHSPEYLFLMLPVVKQYLYPEISSLIEKSKYKLLLIHYLFVLIDHKPLGTETKKQIYKKEHIYDLIVKLERHLIGNVDISEILDDSLLSLDYNSGLDHCCYMQRDEKIDKNSLNKFNTENSYFNIELSKNKEIIHSTEPTDMRDVNNYISIFSKDDYLKVIEWIELGNANDLSFVTNIIIPSFNESLKDENSNFIFLRDKQGELKGIFRINIMIDDASGNTEYHSGCHYVSPELIGNYSKISSLIKKILQVELLGTNKSKGNVLLSNKKALYYHIEKNACIGTEAIGGKGLIFEFNGDNHLYSSKQALLGFVYDLGILEKKNIEVRFHIEGDHTLGNSFDDTTMDLLQRGYALTRVKPLDRSRGNSIMMYIFENIENEEYINTDIGKVYYLQHGNIIPMESLDYMVLVGESDTDYQFLYYDNTISIDKNDYIVQVEKKGNLYNSLTKYIETLGRNENSIVFPLVTTNINEYESLLNKPDTFKELTGIFPTEGINIDGELYTLYGMVDIIVSKNTRILNKYPTIFNRLNELYFKYNGLTEENNFFTLLESKDTTKLMLQNSLGLSMIPYLNEDEEGNIVNTESNYDSLLRVLVHNQILGYIVYEGNIIGFEQFLLVILEGKEDQLDYIGNLSNFSMTKLVEIILLMLYDEKE